MVQPPRERNRPGPRDQNKGGDDAGERRIRDGKRDPSGRGVSPNVLVVLRVDRRQDDSCAQRDRDPCRAIEFALPLAC